MDFFDKLGKKASEAYKITADKTGKLAKEARLKMKISDLRGQVNDVYEEIGKKVYEKHVKNEELNIKTDLEEECTKIDILNAEIKNNQKECLELKDKKTCPKCQEEIDKDDLYCPKCGGKQPEEQVKEVEVVEENKEENENLEKTVEVESNIDKEE